MHSLSSTCIQRTTERMLRVFGCSVTAGAEKAMCLQWQVHSGVSSFLTTKLQNNITLFSSAYMYTHCSPALRTSRTKLMLKFTLSRASWRTDLQLLSCRCCSRARYSVSSVGQDCVCHLTCFHDLLTGFLIGHTYISISKIFSLTVQIHVNVVMFSRLSNNL